MFYTDDPLSDFERWDMEQSRQLARCPVCSRCGEPIQEEDLWDFDGDLYHTDCAEIEFKRNTEDYIE